MTRHHESFFLSNPYREERKKETLESLALRLSRLTPDHRDPHRFHEAKSEIVRDLRRLAGDTPFKDESAKHGERRWETRFHLVSKGGRHGT